MPRRSFSKVQALQLEELLFSIRTGLQDCSATKVNILFFFLDFFFFFDFVELTDKSAKWAAAIDVADYRQSGDRLSVAGWIDGWWWWGVRVVKCYRRRAARVWGELTVTANRLRLTLTTNGVPGWRRLVRVFGLDFGIILPKRETKTKPSIG